MGVSSQVKGPGRVEGTWAYLAVSEAPGATVRG